MLLPYDWRERIRISNIREYFNRNPVIIIGVTVGIILLALVFMVLSWASHRKPSQQLPAYFMDENTQEVQLGSNMDIPPLKGSGGNMTLVRAMYWTCSDCNHKQVAYLMKYTDAMKTKLEEEIRRSPSGMPSPELTIASQNEILVRATAKGSKWFPVGSEDGEKIRTSFPCPSGMTAHPCAF